MKNSFRLAFRIWFLANVVLTILTGGLVVLFAIHHPMESMLIMGIGGLIASTPVILVLGIAGQWLVKSRIPDPHKRDLYIALCMVMALALGALFTFVFMMLHETLGDIQQLVLLPLTVLSAVLLAIFMSRKKIGQLISPTSSIIDNTHNMETESQLQEPDSRSSGILTKALITGGLILVMLIPTIFITNLVNERKARQLTVSTEVSQKWSGPQVLAGPFLYVPYAYTATNEQNKQVRVETHFWILPDELKVDGNLDHEIRKRSIYKVLLYQAQLQEQGHFTFRLPKDVLPEMVRWDEIKVCMGISDFKGIGSRVVVKTGTMDVELSPGLPSEDLAARGLSAAVGITAADLNKPVEFSTNLQLKGSEKLHFLPLGGNSAYNLKSKWPAPSFDGNALPLNRAVKDSGFHAVWQFNKANLPFGTLLSHGKMDLEELAFGVTMVQPADQYAKTDRAVKYAILVIGLTFSLFFIIEIMQKKPVHPVQYVLVGIALVIFYTLLLSISEFLPFDQAYGIAALATITLVSVYVRAHFGNWRSTALFSLVLLCLYTFIFVLIRLEDTALLVGSIGLFVILAIAMYLSRKVDWYGHKGQPLLTS